MLTDRMSIGEFLAACRQRASALDAPARQEKAESVLDCNPIDRARHAERAKALRAERNFWLQVAWHVERALQNAVKLFEQEAQDGKAEGLRYACRYLRAEIRRGREGGCGRHDNQFDRSR